MVNIREGCAWPHRGKAEAANRRACDQIRMEAAHIAAQDIHPLAQAQITATALVIGGGVSGMTAAQELADTGIPVTLVEQSSRLGGLAVSQNPELAADLSTAVQTHTGITVQLDSLITDVEGSVGSYRVTISRKAHQKGPSTDHEIQTTCGAIIVASGIPDQETANLARLLRLTQDRDGFLPEWRVRLRPDHFIERGIYVCGSAHFPCGASEAQFQAYSTASRALRHLRRGKVAAHGSMAQVDLDKCNGCGDCVYACPFAAAAMTKRTLHPGEPGEPDLRRDEGLSLAVIDRLLCTGCGNCVSVCPVGAVTLAGWTDAQLEAQMQVALEDAAESAEPRILIFACAWSGYAAAELAGAQMLTYPPNLRLICLECSGRLQPGLILKALELGAAGVLVLGCAPRLCHYERGNQRAAAAQKQVEAITGLLGIPRARLQLAWVPPDDGPAFAELVTRFVEGVEEV
jgi:heterodisulfide reductase subunit A-like polyferredoxin/coenzyme F420-reducing hydrogenase delta subunit